MYFGCLYRYVYDYIFYYIDNGDGENTEVIMFKSSLQYYFFFPLGNKKQDDGQEKYKF